MEHIKLRLNLDPQRGSEGRGRMQSERSEILEEILGQINSERIGTEFKATTAKRLAIKLAHIPTKDLYYLKSEAYSYQKRNGSFSKYIFGSIKVRGC